MTQAELTYSRTHELTYSPTHELTYSPHKKVFVGREKELERWKRILEDPIGQAVVVVGESGRGKTRLLDRMSAHALARDRLNCAVVRYLLLPGDSPGMVMRIVMEDAFLAARAAIAQLPPQGKRFQQWNIAFERLGFPGFDKETRNVSGKNRDECYALLNALRFDSRKNVFDQFCGRLAFLSERMPETARLLIVLDPEREMPLFRSEMWRTLFSKLPPKIKLLFAQRPDDPLTTDKSIRAQPATAFIPGTLDALGPLSDAEVEEMIALASSTVGAERQKSGAGKKGEKPGSGARPDPSDVPMSVVGLRDALAVYHNEPFAIHGALDLYFLGKLPLFQLPEDGTGSAFAHAQWACLESIPLRSKAEALLKSYALLEAAVPDMIVRTVAGIDPAEFDAIIRHPFIDSLLREEPGGRRIESIHLLDAIRNLQMQPDGTWCEEAKRFHARAVTVYQARLSDNLYPDPLATLQLPEHALHAGGADAFVRALAFCDTAFFTLGLFVTYAALLDRAIALVVPGSLNEVDLRYHLGRVRLQQRDFEAAREELFAALELLKQHDDPARGAKIAMQIGELFLRWKHPGKAIQIIEHAIGLLRLRGDTSGLIEGLRMLGDIHVQSGDFQQGETAIKEALELCDTISVPRHKLRATAGVYCALGRIDEARSRFDAATEKYLKALELTRHLYDREVEAEIFQNLCDIKHQAGDLKGAEHNQWEALRIYEELKMIEHAANAYLNLAELALQSSKPTLAREHFQKARTLFKQFGNRERIAEIDGRLASTD